LRLIYDAIGAAPGAGGPEVHGRELLCAWMRKYPDDEVIVIGSRWRGISEEVASRIRWFNWPTGSIVWRAIGQMLVVPIVVQTHRRHVLLSTLTVLSPLSPRRRSFIFAHDWRHLTRPEEFSTPKRAYRRIWRKSAARATITFCISDKTLRETQKVAPRSTLVLAESGHDHALRWTLDTTASSSTSVLTDDAKVVVTFGHRNNKRPELVIRALATLIRSGYLEPLQLVVLGAEGHYRTTLRELVNDESIGESVLLPGFVDDTEYQRIMRRADCVILASTDEGFGLPVAEALSLGHQVIVTADSGLTAVFAESVVEVAAEPGALACAISKLLANPAPPLASLHTWEDTAATVRTAIIDRVRRPGAK
jgi:glycosyltransferase involved in cell wall biosynthesis